MELIIDAQNKRLGTIASEAAHKLMGKHEPTYSKHAPVPHQVKIINAAKLSLTDKKPKQKTYVRYSGYPSGLKILTMNQLIAKKGHAEVVRLAVYGMLPRNRQRPLAMKRLTITE